MNRLEDMRSNIDTLEAAKEILSDIATHTARVEVAKAKCELKITEAKVKLAEGVAEEVKAIAELEKNLKTFIVGHTQYFVKPRKIVTEFGSFGQQEVTEVIISDEDKLVEELMSLAYEDCLKVVRTPLSAPLKKRLEAGEKIPFCRLSKGDTAVYKVSKTFVDAKLEEALK